MTITPRGRKFLMLRSGHGRSAAAAGKTDPDLCLESDMYCQVLAAMAVMDEGEGLIWKRGETGCLGGGGRITTCLSPQMLHFSADAPGGRPPDVIFARGGYAVYEPVLAACPDAKKIYYGGGRRWKPEADRYDLVLVDTPDQAAEIRPGAEVWYKPAATCFGAVECEKKYDVVFCCHSDSPHKGHKWLLDRLPGDLRILRIGPEDPLFVAAAECGDQEVIFTGKIDRREIPPWAAQARVAVVCDDGTQDSGPRILAEYLAMDIPVIVRRTVRADLGFYINERTGRAVGEDRQEFRVALAALLGRADRTDPRRWYDENLSIENAAGQILTALDAAEARG